MSNPRPNARIHVEHPLGRGMVLSLEAERAHYLVRVMRLKEDDCVGLFNGRDGEWLARLVLARQRSVRVECIEKTREQVDAPDVWLLFAPLKKSRTDFAVEKATELGVSLILPVRTEYTNAQRIPVRRLWLTAREAAEQCHGLSVPEIREIADLPAVLESWPEDRLLLFCDEEKRGAANLDSFRPEQGKLAILIGPEGGFSQGERIRLRRFASAVPVRLGDRLLRAETAVAAALSIINIGRLQS